MGILLGIYLKEKEKDKKDKHFFAVNNESHLTNFLIDEVSHNEEDKGASATLILDHAPFQGSSSQGECGIWTRTPPGPV